MRITRRHKPLKRLRIVSFGLITIMLILPPLGLAYYQGSYLVAEEVSCEKCHREKMGEIVATEHGIHLSKIVNYTLSKGRSTSFGCMVCHVGTARLKEFGIKGFSARPDFSTQSYEATGGEIISWPATQSTTYTDVNNNYTRLDTVWEESMKKDVKMFNIGGKSYSDAEFWYYVVSRMIELSGGNYFKHEMRYTTDSGGYCWCHTEQLGQSYIGYDGGGPVGFNVPSESNNPIESEGKKYYGKEAGKQPAHVYVQCWECHSLAPGRH